MLDQVVTVMNDLDGPKCWELLRLNMTDKGETKHVSYVNFSSQGFCRGMLPATPRHRIWIRPTSRPRFGSV